MGVTGLWRLLEPSGKPVPLETLENKVLAVDISIWLHQMVTGYQDARGAPVANAHLLGLFQRLCKLLYYRIKPVFVFDGGAPALKRETLAKRRSNKAKINSESERLKREIMLLVGQKAAIGSMLGLTTPSPKKMSNHTADKSADDDMFKLPEIKNDGEEESESESESDASFGKAHVDMHNVDLDSHSFKNMTLREKHDLLTELKETRKESSWGRLHELPKQSDNFSSFQMERLLKRRKVQECLVETEKEMGGHFMSLNELENLLNEDGVDTTLTTMANKRIASNENARYLLIRDVKKAIEEAKKKEEANKFAELAEANKDEEVKTDIEETKGENEDIEEAKKGENEDTEEAKNVSTDKELEKDIQKAIEMSLQPADSQNNVDSSLNSSFMVDSDYSDSSEETIDLVNYEFSSAKAYICQNSDFTSSTISEIINETNGKIDKGKRLKSKAGYYKKTSALLKQSEVQNAALSEEDDEVVTAQEIKNEIIEVDDSLNTTDEKPADINLFEDEDLQKAIQMSLECSSPKNVTKSETSDEQEDKTDKLELPSPQEFNTAEQNSTSADNSDSESESFEEVPIVPKPVVELNLNLSEQLDGEDIFADVFESTPPPLSKLTSVPAVKIEQFCLTADVKKTDAANPVLEKSVMFEEKKKLEVNISEPQKPEIIVDKKELVVKNHDKEKNENGESDIITAIEAKSTITESEHPKISEDKLQLNDGIEENEVVQNETRKPISKDELQTMSNEVEAELSDLTKEQNKMERMGINISKQMTQDAQELLQLFGIPYIVAPMEAEAQCAFLEMAKLTEGTITDDSDIWLFGGRTVYKHFFNQKKVVLQFLADRIERSFNLSREQLILLALLVGSDYTTGVQGIGPVTALEILASFPGKKTDPKVDQDNSRQKYVTLAVGLQEFKQWVRAGKRTDSKTLRNKLKNVSVDEDFPSIRVIQAYLEPSVETSKEAFTWGTPDITILREYTRTKFGWSQHKLDEIINPVLKRFQEKKLQKSLTEFFKRKVELTPLDDNVSKRVRAAVRQLGPESDKYVEDNLEPKKKVVRKRRAKKSDNANKAAEDANPEAEPDEKKTDNGEEDTNMDPGESKTTKKGTKRRSVRLDESEIEGVVAVKQVRDVIPDNIEFKLLKRYQEVIPQREKDKMSVLQNKLRAIEMFRKANMDRNAKKKKRVPIKPKADAGLSEGSDTN